jgi:exodeoxyribonuclease VII small subunit
MKFEDSLKRLEEIVETLDKGESPLEDSLKLFEEGMKIAASCSKKLEEMQKKIEKLKKTEDGVIEKEPFQPLLEKEEEE